MAVALKAIISRVPDLTVLSLILVISAGIAVFLSASYAFNVKELKDILAWISKRR
jgi:hypothetical protein